MCLLDVLRESFNDVVLIGLGERLYLADYAYNGRLLDQQARVELRLILLLEAALYLGDFIPAVEQLKLLVDVGQSLLDDRVDGKTRRPHHKKRESLHSQAVTFGGFQFLDEEV